MRKTTLLFLGALLSLFLISCQPVTQSNNRLNVAKLNDGQLQRPDVSEWVFMGTNLGLGYAEGEFRSDRPGTFQIVHMEPTAYRYFQHTGEYADGTMFSLSFYDVQEKSTPELNGFGQGELISFEIHLLDKAKFEEQRAFFLFNDNAEHARIIPPGSECVQCHNEHAAFDGTFTQFYPLLRQTALSQ